MPGVQIKQKDRYEGWRVAEEEGDGNGRGREGEGEAQGEERRKERERGSMHPLVQFAQQR